MYLSENRTLRMATLCGLYVAQGVPWGFVSITFAAWLAQPKHDLTVEEIGPILAVATLPWSFKFIWGPLMDRFTIRRFGRRRPWIIFAQSMAILVLGSMIFIDDLPSMIWTEAPANGRTLQYAYRFVPGPLAALILLANVFVSMQDVAVDALAVDLLKEEERGIANGLMYGSSYLGTAIGGAGLGYIVVAYGIQAGLAGQALLLSMIMLLPLIFRERPPSAELLQNRRRLSDAPGAPMGGDGKPAGSVLSAAEPSSGSIVWDLLRAFSLRATLIGVFVALSVRIASGILTAVLLHYLMTRGGWAQEEYTSMVGGYAVGVGLIAAAAGGFLADKVGPKVLIVITSLLLGATWMSFGLFHTMIESKPLVIAMFLGQEFLLAAMSVSLFSLFMGISWPRVAATQFTTYMAMMNLSATIGAYMAGMLSEKYDVFQILLIAGGMQAILVVPVLLIDARQTRRVLGNS
jgi:PAT family beta-lactamase induction signal transducer AmpG